MKYPSHFYPRPPRGGRHPVAALAAGVVVISIHALREEGDLCNRRRGAGSYISIHALREEGDRDPHRAGGGYRISIHALREEGDLQPGGSPA